MPKVYHDRPDTPEFRPATSVEARENQMIALAVDAAEKQLRDGTASPSVIVHYLKLGTTRERLEKEILERQAAKLTAQIEALQSLKSSEELYKGALEAMRSYSATPTPDDEY